MANAIAASLADVGIKAKWINTDQGPFTEIFSRENSADLSHYIEWYDPEIQACSELMDFYIKGMRHAYCAADEMDRMMRKGMYAETDEELAKWGRKISKYLRESHITTFLWVNHTA